MPVIAPSKFQKRRKTEYTETSKLIKAKFKKESTNSRKNGQNKVGSTKDIKIDKIGIQKVFEITQNGQNRADSTK